MIRRQLLALLAVQAIHADPITWVAETPNNDMETAANWSPSTVPGGTDDAIFDSQIHHIATNPTENTNDFLVSNFNFLHKASPFTFSFNNHTLTFVGDGITGSNTDCTIQAVNINNTSFLGDLIAFDGVTGTSGMAHLISTNTATLSGNVSGSARGTFEANVCTGGPFSVANGGTITASNTGTDGAVGTGNNGVSNTTDSQLRWDDTFTAGNDVVISVSNSGTFSGVNSTQGDAVAIINGGQFESAGAFIAGNNFSCTLSNSGTDSCSGVGLSNIGQLNGAQMNLRSSGVVGDNCTISLSNIGLNNSAASGFPDFVGYLNDEQFAVVNAFQAGNDFTLTVSNTGTDSSSGHGQAIVAGINSNSGTTGEQILWKQGGSVGERALIQASNSGTYSGINTSGGPSVAVMNLAQIAIGDSTSPGSHVFTAGDHFTLNADARGTDSGHGAGGDAVGIASTDQVTFFTTCTLGDNATLTATKSGEFTGSTSASYANVGSTGGSQFYFAGAFQAGNDFALNASNSGMNSCTGLGANFIGDIITGQQASFQNGFAVGNDATINITNTAINSSATTNQNQVGSLLGYGKQLLIKESFQTGNNFRASIANSGQDTSSGSGNYAAFINNNTADHTASQFHLDSGGVVGQNARIELSNSGTYQGNNTGGSLIGVLAGQQFCSTGSFQAGNDFNLAVSNIGTSNATGQSNNSIGSVGTGGQVEFGDTCTLGSNASITISNRGINNDASGTNNLIGYVGDPQMRIVGAFTAGENLSINISNTRENVGDPSNLVGYVNCSHLFFEESCTLGNNSLISVFNSGTIADAQIVFKQGFDITGKARIQAINEGSIGLYGIEVRGNNAGGNADIVLGNSSLYVESTSPTFTIASLTGDVTSFVQSLPTLIINTDSATSADFKGDIQNFPDTNSALTKQGPGTQKLSGVNTYTGLTRVNEGTLVLSGSVAGNVTVNPLGILKGSGMIGGNLTNLGTISPGESIGTMTVLGNYFNNGGNYTVEVNGAGQSDLIDVSGSATLNGGTVIVSSEDGSFRFRQPYTIVQAENGVTGAYAGAASLAFINPLLSYDENHVYLTIFSGLSNAAVSCNQLGVARILDSIINPNNAQTLLISTIANLPLKQAQNALENLSGYQYTNDLLLSQIAMHRFLRRLYDPLRTPSCQDWTAWAEIGDSITHLRGKPAHNTNVNTYDITAGIQKSFCHDITLGFAGSYEYDHLNYRRGSADWDTGFAAIYGLYNPNAFYVLADLVYACTSSVFNRRFYAEEFNSKFHLNSFAFYGETGIDYQCGCALIQPFFGIQSDKTCRGRIKESSSSDFALKIKKQNLKTTSTRLGLHLSFENAHFDIAWNRLLSSPRNKTSGQFLGQSFDICGNNFDRNSLDYTLGVTSCFCDQYKAYLEIGGEIWEHANTTNLRGGIEFSW